MTTVATRGSRENLRLLETGQVDVGQVEGNAAHAAFADTARSASRLRVLAVMYPNPGMFAVRSDSPYRSIDDLKGQPVVFGTRASGLHILAEDMLDGLGLDAQRDFTQILLDNAGDGPRLVLEGRAEALWGAGIGWPGFARIADAPGGARFIAPSPRQVERIRGKHPHLVAMSVPAGSYTGQDSDIHSLGLWSLTLVRHDLDDEVAYRLARAIDQGHEALVARLPQARYTTPANTVRAVAGDRIHPGAARYYRELGLLAAH